MNARVPADVDLEDRLIYGLTPIRFGYLVVAALFAFTVWSSLPLPHLARLAVATPMLCLGAGLAWGQHRGRHMDAWLVDLSCFVKRNYRLELIWKPSKTQRVRRLEAPELAIKPESASMVLEHAAVTASMVIEPSYVVVMSGGNVAVGELHPVLPARELARLAQGSG